MKEFSENDIIKILRGEFLPVTTRTYEELYVPLKSENPEESLIGLNITFTSTADQSGAVWYYLVLRFRDADDRMNAFIQDEDNPLILMDFTDPWLEEALGFDFAVGGKFLSTILNVNGQAPILKGTVGVGDQAVIFDTSSIKITDVTGETYTMSVSLYRPQ